MVEFAHGECLEDDECEHRTEQDAADEPREQDGARAEPHLVAKRGRAHALSLQIEELAGLVAELDGDSQRDADERECQREERRGSEHEQRAARQRVCAELLLDCAPRRHSDRARRALRQPRREAGGA